jgi:hypothetical protein
MEWSYEDPVSPALIKEIARCVAGNWEAMGGKSFCWPVFAIQTHVDNFVFTFGRFFDQVGLDITQEDVNKLEVEGPPENVAKYKEILLGVAKLVKSKTAGRVFMGKSHFDRLSGGE